MRHRWIWAIAGVVVVGAAAADWHLMRDSTSATARSTQSAPAPAIPVAVGVSETKDVPLYPNGPGIVQAFNTVTIHMRVDEQLLRVHSVEGQDVKVGDLLAEIDPAPFQAALDQAIARKVTDEVAARECAAARARLSNIG